MKARKALAQFSRREFWNGVFSEVALSRFLQFGSKESPNFRADFDWLLSKGKDQTENFLKVTEGKYRDP